MASILQDLEVVEVILGDIAAFAAGQPATVTKSIGGETYTLAVVVLPNGPTGTPYQVISGSFWSVFLTALADASAIAAGAPLQIAEKIGNTWYGSALSVAQIAKSA